MLGDTSQKYLIKKNEATAHRGELEKGGSVRMRADTQAGISVGLDSRVAGAQNGWPRH